MRCGLVAVVQPWKPLSLSSLHIAVGLIRKPQKVWISALIDSAETWWPLCILHRSIQPDLLLPAFAWLKYYWQSQVEDLVTQKLHSVAQVLTMSLVAVQFKILILVTNMPASHICLVKRWKSRTRKSILGESTSCCSWMLRLLEMYFQHKVCPESGTKRHLKSLKELLAFMRASEGDEIKVSFSHKLSDFTFLGKNLNYNQCGLCIYLVRTLLNIQWIKTIGYFKYIYIYVFNIYYLFIYLFFNLLLSCLDKAALH